MVASTSRTAALAIAATIATTTRVAAGELACDAGVVCPDEDGDGFAACGCAFSGTPCDCDDRDPATFPGAPETCDAVKDHNCSGLAPERCPRKKGCWEGACVPECVPLDDFGCATGSRFAKETDSGTCVCAPDDCTLFGCPAGLTCDESKHCVPTCHPGVRCPFGQVCRGFGCVDPCAEVTCPEGSVCDEGRCIPSCACTPGAPCPAGETCDLAAPIPKCVETACIGVTCPAGAHCEKGACVSDCEEVVCPPMRVCRRVSLNGAPAQPRCVDLCSPNPCEPGFACDWRTAACTPLPTADGGLSAPEAILDPLVVGGGGWVCSTSAVASAGAATAIGSALAAVALATRRARGRRRR